MNISSGVYVLKLTKDKFYVGSSIDIPKRITEHLSSNYASAWTNLYPVEKVWSIFPREEHELRKEEEQVVFNTMEQFGINNVRGGAFSQVELEHNMYETLQKLLIHRRNACFKCGMNGHYINDCPNETKKSGFWNYIQQGLSFFHYDNVNCVDNNNNCYRCGRTGHFASNCFAKTHVNGSKINL